MSSIADLNVQLAHLQSMVAESEDDAEIAIYTTKIASIKIAVAELVANSTLEIAPTAVPRTPLLDEKQVQLAKGVCALCVIFILGLGLGLGLGLDGGSEGKNLLLNYHKCIR